MLFMIMAFMTLPGETEAGSISMILPGIVYEDSTIFQQGDWMGLFVPDSGMCTLRLVELEVVREQDPLYDWERPAGLIVTTPQEEQRPLVLLMSPDGIVTPGPVEMFLGVKLLLPPDTTFIFRSESVETAEFQTSEDGLFMTADQLTQTITETTPGNGPSAPYMNLIWAGDLDRDGMIDFILDDVDNDYLIYSWDLYLSSTAAPGQLVEKVESFYDVYY